MAIYLSLLLAVGALAAVLYYFFGSSKGETKERHATTESRGERRGLIHVVARTDPGLKRKHNEDSFLVLEEQALFAVADGMGRHAAGEVASKMAVDVMTAYFQEGKTPTNCEGIPMEGCKVRDAILAANDAIFSKANDVHEYHGMGTTMVTLYFSEMRERAIIGNAGDSRCYRFRKGELKQLTTDHTLGAVGIVGSNAALLSRAVGIEENLEVDIFVEAPLPGDIYLLCSDGLSRMVEHPQLQQVLSNTEKSLDDRAHELIEKANLAGGRDNVTLILVQVASGKVDAR